MIDLETATLVRALLNEICDNKCKHDHGTQPRVSSGIVQGAIHREPSVDDIERYLKDAPINGPTMWR